MIACSKRRLSSWFSLMKVCFGTCAWLACSVGFMWHPLGIAQQVAFVPDGEFSAQTVIKWQQAGAELGWMDPHELSDFAGMQFYDASTTPDEDWLPAFRFANWTKAQAAELPAPEASFGLSVAGTDFGDADIDLIRTYDKLEVIDASRSELTNAGLPALSNLNQLRGLSLYLGFTNISSEGLSELQRLSQLESLDVGQTLCDDRAVSELSKLRKLHTLRLASTQVTATGLAEFAGHPRLQVLDLSSNNVDDTWIDALATLPDLRRLDLSATQVGQAHLKGLDRLTSLEELDLSFTKTTDSALPALENLTQLQKLDLRGCSWSEENLQSLRSKLPSCKILFAGP